MQRRRTHREDDRSSSLVVHMRYFFHSVRFLREGVAQYALVARKTRLMWIFLGTGTFEDLQYLEGPLDADVMGMKYLQVDGVKPVETTTSFRLRTREVGTSYLPRMPPRVPHLPRPSTSGIHHAKISPTTSRCPYYLLDGTFGIAFTLVDPEKRIKPADPTIGRDTPEVNGRSEFPTPSPPMHLMTSSRPFRRRRLRQHPCRPLAP